MSRWTAESDYDYLAWCEGRRGTPAREKDQPETVQAVCASCGGWFETDPHQPERICRACGALQELTALLNKDQGAA